MLFDRSNKISLFWLLNFQNHSSCNANLAILWSKFQSECSFNLKGGKSDAVKYNPGIGDKSRQSDRVWSPEATAFSLSCYHPDSPWLRCSTCFSAARKRIPFISKTVADSQVASCHFSIVDVVLSNLSDPISYTGRQLPVDLEKHCEIFLDLQKPSCKISGDEEIF